MSENRYLRKLAADISEDDKNALKTFGLQSAASIPAHLAGAYLGGRAASKFIRQKSLPVPGAKAISSGLGRIGKPGSWLSSKIPRRINSKELGLVAGMGLAGGVADLWALRRGFHSSRENAVSKAAVNTNENNT